MRTLNPKLQQFVNPSIPDFGEILTELVVSCNPQHVKILQVQAFRRLLINRFAIETDPAALIGMAQKVVEHTVREYAPLVLEEAGVTSIAEAVRALKPITGYLPALDARQLLDHEQRHLREIDARTDLGNRQYEAAQETLEHSSLACDLFAQLSTPGPEAEVKEQIACILACSVAVQAASAKLPGRDVESKFWFRRMSLFETL